MKKQYNSPEIEIERFWFEDILTTSGGIGAGDGVDDNDSWGDGDDQGFIIPNN